MRLEDLSLSAFIAGTAIGYLIWYWVRGGGTRTELQRHRILAAAAVICGIILALLLIVALWGVQSLASGNLGYWALVALLALILIEVVIWWFWPRARREGHYALEFQALLAILFAFVLSFLIIILLWGPQSLFLLGPNRWFITAPLGALLLGILFGGVAGEWVHYIMLPGRLRTKALTLAHRRWGYILLIVLALGILYPVFPQLLARLGSANVATPVGSFSFTLQTVQPVQGVHGGGSHTEQILSTDSRKPWPSLTVLQQIADRDVEYANLFSQPTDDKDALRKLHDDSKPFITQVLVPLGKCVDAHFNAFHSPALILIGLRHALGVYRDAVHAANPPASSTTLRDKFAEAAKHLATDLPGANACSSAEESIKKAPGNVPMNLPYAALGLAYLFYDGQAIEQAAREVARWIDQHFGPANSTQMAACNSTESDSCAINGYKGTGGWHQLPRWYLIRAQFELAAILGSTRAARSTFLASKNTAEKMSALFVETDIGSAERWIKNCRSPSPKLSANDSMLQRRVVLSYVTMIDQMLSYLATLAETSSLDDEVSISPDMLEYARTNSKVDLSCFPGLLDESDRGAVEGQLLASYGILLTQIITKREPPFGLSDLERAGRNDAILTARATLQRAVSKLGGQVRGQSDENRKKPPEDQLFLFTEYQLYLSRAQSKLAEINALLQ